MGKEKVLEELDRRIKRLEAEIEFAEERLRYLEEIGAPSKYKALKRRDYSVYYTIFIGVWMLVGLLAFMSIKDRLPGVINIPLLPYLFITLSIILIPILYLMWSKNQEVRTPMDEFEERERLARTIIASFYRPLMKAIEEDDKEAMKNLAEELLRNPVLAGAIERMNEGDPKLMAYALYLYASYTEGLEDEVKETISRLHNKPLRALLETLIET